MTALAPGIASLGYRTDVMLLELQGSTAQDRGDHLVVRSPRNPTFYWGNFLLFRTPPAPGDLPRWERAFTAELPGATHRAFGVDVALDVAASSAGGDEQAAVGDYAEFAAAGYDVDASSVLTATRVHEPPHPNRSATYRALDLADPADSGAAIAVQLANGPDREPVAYLEFLTHRMAAMRDLQAAGWGAWFGAFDGGRLLCGLGLFTDGSGVARFQNVDTHPQARGRGLAGTLVHHASEYGFAKLGATTLVIVADPDYLAIDVYRSVGFEVTETQVQLEKAPA